MAELELRKVEHWQRRKRVLDGLSLKAPPGRVTALLGDADSGRVAVLKVVAGIEKAHGGAILVGGTDVTRARPGGRDVATVFRAAALMPHKSAYENIAYPLRLARFDRETIEARVAAVGEHFGLTDALDLRPRKLTDVQCYQIGLARALVRDPAIYLFELPPPDDAALRDLAIAETRRLRGEFGRTVIFATESAEEARSLADWIVVLQAQCDSVRAGRCFSTIPGLSRTWREASCGRTSAENWTSPLWSRLRRSSSTATCGRVASTWSGDSACARKTATSTCFCCWSFSRAWTRR